jgi:hypothetical protein
VRQRLEKNFLKIARQENEEQGRGDGLDQEVT